MTDWLPEPLLEIGLWGLAYWQWLGIAAGLLTAIVAGRILGRLVLWMAARIASRTDSKWDDLALERLGRPVRFLGKVVVARLLLPVLELPGQVVGVSENVLLALVGVGVIWGVVATVDVIVARIAGAEWAIKRPSSRALLSLASKIAKVVLVIIAVISFLSAFGVPVTSLIAGLGIGGIALAFGAQKTVENLFGAFSLGVDQPLREGDFVKIDDQTLGTVESIGLRSTRVRTLDRTVVTLPNGRVAGSRIETYAARDRVRMHTTITLEYATTAVQMREVVAGFERVLRAHPETFLTDVIVKFVNFGASSLDVEVMAWCLGNDFNAFRAWRQDILFGFMEVVEQAGTSFAYPTQTLHVASLPAAPAER